MLLRKKAFRYVTHEVQENNRQGISNVGQTVMKLEVSEIQKPVYELESQSSADKFQLNKCSF